SLTPPNPPDALGGNKNTVTSFKIGIINGFSLKLTRRRALGVYLRGTRKWLRSPAKQNGRSKSVKSDYAIHRDIPAILWVVVGTIKILS
ncbi:hypothetical protein QT972_21340, partial [Microcoleus sp. herbarium7]